MLDAHCIKHNNQRWCTISTFLQRNCILYDAYGCEWYYSFRKYFLVEFQQQQKQHEKMGDREIKKQTIGNSVCDTYVLVYTSHDQAFIFRRITSEEKTNNHFWDHFFWHFTYFHLFRLSKPSSEHIGFTEPKNITIKRIKKTEKRKMVEKAITSLSRTNGLIINIYIFLSI